MKRQKAKVFSVVYCLLPTVYCLLPTVYCLVSGCAKKQVVLEGYEEGAFLGFKFVPGKSVSYKQTQNINTTFEIKGMAQTIATSIELRTNQTVEDTGEIVSLSIRFDDVVGTARVGTEIQEVKELDELKGKVISLKLSKDGKITELKGLEGVDYFRKAGERPERQFEEQFGFLPNNTVKIGESWTREFEGKVATYTLKGFEKVFKESATCAKIEVKANIDLTRTMEEQGMRGELKLTGKERGEILFDVERGIVIEAKASASLEGMQELKVPAPMSIPVYIDQETRTVLIK